MTTMIMNNMADTSDRNWSIVNRICAFLNGEKTDEPEEVPATPSVDIEQVTEDILDLLDEGACNDFENFDEDKLVELCKLLGLNDIEKDFVKFSEDDWLPFAAGVHYYFYEPTSQFKNDIKSDVKQMTKKIHDCNYTFYRDVDNYKSLGQAVYDEVTDGKGLPYKYSILEDFIDYERLGEDTYHCCSLSKEGKPSYNYYGFFAPMIP